MRMSAVGGFGAAVTRQAAVVEDNGATRRACCALPPLIGRRHAALHREVGQKRLRLRFAHLPGVALAVGTGVNFHPVDAGSLGPLSVPQPPDPVPNQVQQLGRRNGAGNGG